MSVNVLLLSAGYGKRLRPLTNSIPKCLVTINGKVLLDIWLKNLIGYRFESFVINTHYLHNKVNKYIVDSIYKDKVKLVYEDQLRGTAGTLINNINSFKGDDLLMAHADNYCFPDFEKFKQAHQNRPKGCLLTMMTFNTESPTECGIVELDSKNIVVDFYEKVKRPPSNLANAAVYILSKEFLNIIASKFSHCQDFSTEILPYFLGRIFTYHHTGVFIDIGTPEAYERANSL